MEQNEYSYFIANDGTRLVYQVSGQGRLVILLHAFMIDSKINWLETNIYSRLLEAGYKSIWLDLRGHGLSDKPHHPSAYAEQMMETDVRKLMDRMDAKDVILVGYSMGASLALSVAMRDSRVLGVVAAGTGLGETLPWDPDNRRTEVASMREAAPNAPGFYRQMADQLGDVDRLAFAARLEGASFPIYTEAQLRQLKMPVCIVNGEDDVDPSPLAQLIENAWVMRVQGDHLSAIWQPDFSEEVLACFTEIESYHSKDPE